MTDSSKVSKVKPSKPKTKRIWHAHDLSKYSLPVEELSDQETNQEQPCLTDQARAVLLWQTRQENYLQRGMKGA